MTPDANTHLKAAKNEVTSFDNPFFNDKMRATYGECTDLDANWGHQEGLLNRRLKDKVGKKDVVGVAVSFMFATRLSEREEAAVKAHIASAFGPFVKPASIHTSLMEAPGQRGKKKREGATVLTYKYALKDWQKADQVMRAFFDNDRAVPSDRSYRGVPKTLPEAFRPLTEPTLSFDRLDA